MDRPEYYSYVDERGLIHSHLIKTGPYVFGEKITCPSCLDILRALRVELCEKYGWDEWPFPRDYIDE